MQPKKFYYHNLGYWFLFFIILVAAGFYTTYFNRIFEPTPAVIHIHFVLMALWLMMLIAQPFLIKYKKLKWHRLLGKTSYILVPLVLLTAFLLIRNEYYRNIEGMNMEVAKGLKHYSTAEILRRAAATPIGLFYFIWFAVFYFLAIKNRRQSPKHARYMLATALTLTGPTVDRIVGIHFHIYTIAGISSFVLSFLIIDIVLASLLYLDYRNKKETKTLRTCLIIYMVGQLLYYLVPTFDGWSFVMKYIMLPNPS
jgi:hypothetical protein